MPTHPLGRDHGKTRAASAVLAVLALAVGLVGLSAQWSPPAAASPQTVTGASFAWGLNGEQGGGAFFGGCNFLSAGTAGDTGSSRLWTQGDGFYSTQSGNVTVEKPNASGAYAQPTWATKCQDPNGATVNSGSTSSLTRNRVVFGNGTGTVDPTADTAHIQWTGSFTSVFYGGLTYWSATNPTLTVNANGTGTLTATASGYGADRNDPSKWVPLAPTTITLANLHGVTLTSTGFTVTPDYLGVSVTVPNGTTSQPARSADNQAYWGSFPQSFVDFQQLTGQSSYWFTSAGARDAAKPTIPLTVSYSGVAASATPTPTPTPTPTASATATPTDGPTVSLGTPSVTVGGTLSFSATGFEPGETVDVVVHSDPVTLAPATASATGAVTASRTLPASLTAGQHQLTLTGETSKTTAGAAFTVGGAGSAVPASCASDGVLGGSLTWGFKQTFRSYVASGPADNRIEASGGATILGQDLAVAGKAASATYNWPFVSSAKDASATSFDVRYGGAVLFHYPSHFFDLTLANPRLVVHGTTGTLYVDVKLVTSAPGSPPTTSDREQVAFATLDLADATTRPDSTGTTISGIHVVLQDVSAFAYDGTSFYQRGQRIDDATVLLSGCTGDAQPSLGIADAGAGSIASSLPFTGIPLGVAVPIALAAILAGIVLVTVARRKTGDQQ